jgi:DNA-binding MarR family transcriptional regulator
MLAKKGIKGRLPMDYSVLAAELLDKMQVLHKMKPHKNINDAFLGETFVLHYISTRESEVQPGEIGHEMGVSSARVATALNGLENRGLVTRRIDPNDRRKILVGATQTGKELAGKNYKTILGKATVMLENLGERDAREFIRITGRLADNMKNMGDSNPCLN